MKSVRSSVYTGCAHVESGFRGQSNDFTVYIRDPIPPRSLVYSAHALTYYGYFVFYTQYCPRCTFAVIFKTVILSYRPRETIRSLVHVRLACTSTYISVRAVYIIIICKYEIHRGNGIILCPPYIVYIVHHDDCGGTNRSYKKTFFNCAKIDFQGYAHTYIRTQVHDLRERIRYCVMHVCTHYCNTVYL